jgi:hypothetical protein
VSILKFCPNCGTKIEFQQAKFCPDCGISLTVPEKTAHPQPEISQATLIDTDTEKTPNQSPIELETIPVGAKININELGNKLEDVVERIYQSRGYSTLRRQRIKGVSSTLNEIDILAKKNTRTLAIECKNHSSTVGIEPLRDFNGKLSEIGLVGKGVFVAYSGLSQGAEEYAQFHRIEILDNDELAEELLAISVGRTESVKGQSLSLEHTLPINVSFSQATALNLRNKEKVNVSDSVLIFHPYFSVHYNFNAIFTDPSKSVHKFSDRGAVFVDALTATVLNEKPDRGLGVIKAIIKMTSNSAKLESARTRKLVNELKEKNPLLQYDLQIEQNYHTHYQKPATSPRQAIESAMQFIIEKNTTRVSYKVKSRQNEDALPRIGYVTYVPRRKDVQIFRKDIVILPRWSIEFESKNCTYRREILACSGTVLEDTLESCPGHFKLGSIDFSKKQSIAVCEVCGKALCEEHIRQCALCGKWLCSEHSFNCEVCGNRFCLEHEHFKCISCNGNICSTCVTTCPTCNAAYSPKHSLRCDVCGKMNCPNCVITTGLIRKNKTCKKCSK